MPEIHRKRLRHRRRLVWGAVLILLYLVVLGSLWITLWTQAFRLKSFEIVGAKGVAQEDLINLLRWQVMGAGWKHVLGFDNILVWPETLPPQKLAYLPALKNLEIHKDFRERTLRLALEERSPFGIWCLVEREVPECFWFDEEGVILARAPLAEGNLIPVVNDYSQSKLTLGGKILPQEQISNLFSVLRVLAAAKMEAREIRLEDIALSELKVLTYGGPELYFGLRFPADNALAVLNSFRNATGTSGLEKLEYIDFRAENRAYYK